MKKITASVLVALMALSMTACGGSKPAEAPAAAPETEAPAAEAPAAGGFEATETKYPFNYVASEDFDNVKIDCSADEPIELSLGCSGTLGGTVNGDAVEFAQKVVEQATDGKVKVVLYDGGQLGSDTEMMSAMQMGSLDMFTGAPSGQVTMIKDLAVLDIGGAFSSIDNCNTILAGFENLIQPEYNEQGLMMMNCFATDWRLLTSNTEYKSLADLAGSKVRVQENPYHIAFWSALGANPTPLAFGEVYLSLQNGMLDAQENPYGSIIGVKLYEVQKYLYESDHIPFISTNIVSKAKYESLSDAQKLAVNEFLYANKWYIMENSQAAIDDELKTCTDGGMTYIAEMPADIVAQYPVAAQAAVDAMKDKGDVNVQFLADYVAQVNEIEGSSLSVQ